VAKALQSLIPAFLANRRRELETLRTVLAARDYAELRRIGHRMKGAAASYGFDRISAIGREIESAAGAGDAAAIAHEIDAYAAHLATLRVVYCE
jgi:HPt (histidine-containing phosphotransfer) domain-containing protein